MDQKPVVESLRDGKTFIDALVQSGVEVTSAFWAKEDERSQWYLYLVSPMAIDGGARDVYHRIHPVIQQLQAQPEIFWVDPFEIMVLSPADSMAEAAAKLGCNKPRIIRLTGPYLGNVAISGAYIYPSLTKVKAM